MRNAKLSEYRFLKILRGFAYGLPPGEVATESGISEKTVRGTYAILRLKVMEAARSGRPVFGLSSRYLYEDGSLTKKALSFSKPLPGAGCSKATSPDTPRASRTRARATLMSSISA